MGFNSGFKGLSSLVSRNSLSRFCYKVAWEDDAEFESS